MGRKTKKSFERPQGCWQRYLNKLQSVQPGSDSQGKKFMSIETPDWSKIPAPQDDGAQLTQVHKTCRALLNGTALIITDDVGVDSQRDSRVAML